MVFAVEWRGKTVGTVEIEEGTHSISFLVDCVENTEELLRCYGETMQEPLLLGVMEPQGGRLRCKKKMTRQSMEPYGGTLPERYYLSSGKEKEQAPVSSGKEKEQRSQLCVWTGDEALDALIGQGLVQTCELPSGLCLRCVFDKDTPFPLCLAAQVCHIEQVGQQYFAEMDFRGAFYRIGEIP